MKYSIYLVSSLPVFMALGGFYPLRISRDNFWKRIFNNISLSLLGVPLSKFISLPFIFWVTKIGAQFSIGIFHWIKINNISQGIIGFIALDYALYWWHRANHKVRFFWRFHQVHHSDKDMDATTAIRFHFGELVLSSLLKSIIVLIFGLKFELVLFFDFSVSFCSYFQHSNLKLPEIVEEILSKLIVTPLYHQNHHSYFLSETDSNYTTIFNCWDFFHKSRTKTNRASDITIGHPAFENSKMRLIDLVKMPFEPILNWPKNLERR